MSEKQQKNLKLVAFWLFGTVLIVFGAITAYITLVGRTLGEVTIWQALKSGFPIWGITALAAIIIYVAYYFYTKNQS
jgi:hypothetical protein